MDDIAFHEKLWGANCGPCALAEILSTKLEFVRPHLGEFAGRGYMSRQNMEAALKSIGVDYFYTQRTLRGDVEWPSIGLGLIQWGGFESAPIRAQLEYTHWIAINQRDVWDINLPKWTDVKVWEEILLPQIREKYKRADGRYSLRSAFRIVWNERTAASLKRLEGMK